MNLCSNFLTLSILIGFSGLALSADKASNAFVEGKKLVMIDRAVHPGLVADVAVRFTPYRDYKLMVPVPFEQRLEGTYKILRGEVSHPITIVHTANTFIRSLERGSEVTIYLSRFKDRDEFYIIGIFPPEEE